MQIALRRLIAILVLIISTASTTYCFTLPYDSSQAMPQIAAGKYHTLAIDETGRQLAWGYNVYGALGDGSNSTSANVESTNWSNSLQTISAGYWHSLILNEDGSIMTFGRNNLAQLGDGTLISRQTPVPVLSASGSPVTGIKAISAGGYFNIAVKTDGTIISWGSNNYGQLGNNSVTQQASPVTVMGKDGTTLKQVKSVAAGGYQSLALLENGTVLAWGYNSKGQLGNDTNLDSSFPVTVIDSTGTPLSNITEIAAGGLHSLALKSDGSLWAWGYNGAGQLGDSSLIDKHHAVAVTLASEYSGIKFSKIAAGLHYCMALATDGRVFTWGYNDKGQLGRANSTLTYSATPKPITLENGNIVNNAVSIAAGYFSAFAWLQDGSLLSWGENGGGQLANGTTTGSFYATPVIQTNHRFLNIQNGSSGTIKISAQSMNSFLSAPLYGSLSTNFSINSSGTTILFGYTPRDTFSGEDSFITFTKTTGGTLKTLVSVVRPRSSTSVGPHHALSLRLDGTVWAWGKNDAGQLGDGTTNFRSTPVKVHGLSDIIKIKAGLNYSIALDTEGTIWFWGDQTLIPERMTFISNVVDIASANTHYTALKFDGTVWSWGKNDQGQLGDGTKIDRNTPVQVHDLRNIVKIVAGTGIDALKTGGHNLALREDKTVWSWGWNSVGQLGDGTKTSRSTPVKVVGLGNIVDISVSDRWHSLAVKSDGSVWAWGLNDAGQLGNGQTTDSAVPVQVNGLSSVSSVAAGAYFSLALKNSGEVVSWGLNSTGQLGIGSEPSSVLTSQSISGFSDVTNLSAGFDCAMAVKNDGSLWAWGDNTLEKLSVGDGLNHFTPTKVIDENNWPVNLNNDQLYAVPVEATVKAGQLHSVALKSDGTVWAWGANTYGQLGNGSTTNESKPVKVYNLTNIVAISVANFHNIALRSDGTVWVWGDNRSGQLGNGTTTKRLLPMQIPNLFDVIAISTSGFGIYGHTLALKSDGTVMAWGSNDQGQLGNGFTTDVLTPITVSGLQNISSIAAGDRFSMAVDSDGFVWGWGDNTGGQLGDGSTSQSLTPIKANVITNAISIKAGFMHVIAKDANSHLWAWGANSYGYLGIGNTDSQSLPVQLQNLPKIKDIAAKLYHSMALTTDGTALNWGWNGSGQLGDGTLDDSYSPTPIINMAGTMALASGGYHGIALKENGTIWAWGFDNEGQLGDGDNTTRPTPLQILDSSGVPFLVTEKSAPAGLYNTQQEISLRCGNPDGCSAIYYTLDGSMPTTSSLLYDKPITLSTNTTLSFFWTDTTGQQSLIRRSKFIIDTSPPVVSITLPGTPEIKSLHSIKGSVNEQGTGLTSVSIQVTDGTNFLAVSSATGLPFFTTSPTWLPANFDQNAGTWNYDTTTVNWTEGGDYSITVKAIDLAGNSSSSSTSFIYFSGEQAYTSLSTELASHSILQEETLDVSGKLSRLPDTDEDISGLSIMVEVVAPDLSSYTKKITTYDKYGHFIIHDLNGFTQKGSYTIQVSFAGSIMYAGSTASDNVLVGASPGYAIIVEGKVKNSEGLQSHNKTANRIYQQFIDRGFKAADIQYLNYDTNQTGVTGTPSKIAVQNAIETWAAGKMNDMAAPLYLVMVDHGNINTFYVSGTSSESIITPEELSAWLDTLDNKIAGSQAVNEKKMIIIGSCYSGSFIPFLSRSGRIIVTSAAGNEVSYKGPLEPDNIRVGEFFLEELFFRLGEGDSLYSAFNIATENTELFTRSGLQSTNSAYPYFDSARQHPLLDDNGDKIGSNKLAENNNEGKRASQIYLGVGLTNAINNTASFSEVTRTTILNTDQTTALLWGKNQNSANANDVSSAWLELRRPSMVLGAQDSTGQLEIDLNKQLMAYDDQLLNAWIYTFDSFDEAGKYEIYYFTRNAGTGDISPMKRSVVYKRKADNNAPSTFDLSSPANGSKQPTILTFDWQDSIDPENNPLTYTLVIGTSVSSAGRVTDEVFRKEELQSSAGFIDMNAGLLDLTTYYWQVIAIDTYGESSLSEVWSFETDNTNGIPGIIRGIVYSNIDKNLLSNALVSANTGAEVTTELDGSFYLATNSDFITLTCSITGQKSALAENVKIKSGEVTRVELTFGSRFKPGDINHDNTWSLADALLVSQVISGQKTAADVYIDSDIDNDQKLGITEMVYILKKLAE